MTILTPSSPNGGNSDAKKYLLALKSKNDNPTEIWFKIGHARFLKGFIEANGDLKLTETFLKEKHNPKSRGLKGTVFGCGFAYLNNLSHKFDGGVFYIPTQPEGLPLACCVTSTDDLGIEIDHLPREKQLDLYQEFSRVTGLNFFALLSSGGKSIHGHIKLDEHYPIEQVKDIRRLLVIALRGDPATERLHQPMRLPGFFRKEKQAYQELLDFNPDSRYSIPQISTGLSQWFSTQGLAYPESIPDDWWIEFQRILRGSNDLDDHQKAIDIQGKRKKKGSMTC